MFEESHLEKCLDTARILAECLQVERGAIRENNLDRLDEVSSRKQQITAELQRLLTESISGSGQSVSDLVESTIANSPTQGQTRSTLQQELQAMLVKCRDLNAANGAAIHVRRSHVANALRLLLSQAGDSSTYSPEQPVVQFQASRTLADA